MLPDCSEREDRTYCTSRLTYCVAAASARYCKAIYTLSHWYCIEERLSQLTSEKRKVYEDEWRLCGYRTILSEMN